MSCEYCKLEIVNYAEPMRHGEDEFVLHKCESNIMMSVKTRGHARDYYYSDFKINNCPMCGGKLEVVE